MNALQPICVSTYKVYARMDGRLACWEVEAESHDAAIRAVKQVMGSAIGAAVVSIDGGANDLFF